MHLRWGEAGALGTNAIVGGGVPSAAGVAWANRHSGSDAVTVTYFGEGACNIGSVLETMNLAAAWRLPLCFFVENNRYAVATTIEEVTYEPRVSGRGLGFGIPAWQVDGMDPLAVFFAMQEAVAHMRAGQGPTIVEAQVYRHFHQNGSLPGSAFGYRTKEEEKTWWERDPVAFLGRELERVGAIAPAPLADLRRRCQDAMNRVAAELIETPGGAPARIKPDLWPSGDFCDVGIRGDLSEFRGVRFAEPESYSGGWHQGKFVDIIADTLHRRMAEDSRIIVLGEDVHRLKGGTNGATRGLAAAFPGRVLGTPISENAFAGLAGGIAMDGRYIPVVEFMYADFLWVAADQVFNQIAKFRHMFGGDIPMPLVLRIKVAMGSGYGSQHSMDPAGIFATAPGWRIIAPSNPFDYVGLMNSALRCQDPVVVLEHVELYQPLGPCPDDLDYFIPLGTARIARPGTELTVLCYLNMVGHCLKAAEDLDIDAEILDLRSLDRAGIDWQTIGRSIAKTNNVLLVEQGALGTSYGTLLADEIQRRFFDSLDQPVERVHGAMASPSISKVLESAACANRSDVAAAMQRVRNAKGATGMSFRA